jgi:hypothetical protein
MSHIKHVPIPWDDFLSLLDTPSSYSGQGGKFLRVDATPDAVEFTDDVVQKTGSTMTGFLTLSADPSSNLHAATKQYVDSVAQGLDIKESVVAATTASITLSNEQTIDGVGVVDGDRVLVKDQGSGSPHAANGIYICKDLAAWVRSDDADSDAEVTSGMFCFVEEGTTNGDTGWVLTTNDPITVGTTAIEFTQFSGAGTYTNGDGLLLTGNEFSVDFEDTDGNINPVGTQDAGTSNKVARADHVHAHGDQSGGSLHSAVIAAGASGFMTGADKTKLDNIDAGAEVNQNAFSNFDIDAATSVLAADAKTDTVYFTGGTLITLTGTPGTDTLDFAVTGGTDGQVLLSSGTTPTWSTHAFTAMSDTPSSYAGSGGYRVVVNSTPDALEFEANTLLNLDDTMASFTGDGLVRVNAGGTAIEEFGTAAAQGSILFVSASNVWTVLGAGTNGQVLSSGGAAADVSWQDVATTFVGLTDVDEADYTGHAGWLVRVNSTPDGLEFVDAQGVADGTTTGNTLYWNGSAWTESGIIFNDHSNAEVGINTATPNATLHVNGSFSAAITTQTGDYDLDSGTNGDVYTILHNNTAADQTITLPAVATYTGRQYHIKKISGPTYKTTVATTGAENIDGAASYDLEAQYESVTVVSDGSNWHIV